MSTTSCIDVLFFTHIVDRIITFLCDDHQFAAASLQVVCRYWHSKLRTRLFHHIWIADIPWHDHIHFISLTAWSIGTTSLGGNPSLRFTVPPRPDGCKQFNLSYSDDGRALISKNPLVLSTLRSARILDAWCMDSADFLPAMAEGLTVDLQILRLGPSCDHDDAVLPRAETLVIFKGPYEDDDEPFTYSITTMQLAKNLIIHPDECDFALSDLAADLPETLEAVTVFYPFPPGRRGEREVMYDGIMRAVIATITWNFGDHRTLTFVSPDVKTLHDDVANPFEPSWAYFKTRLQLEAPKLLDMVEFLTTAEYRERVGKEMYKLHAYMGMDNCD